MAYMIRNFFLKIKFKFFYLNNYYLNNEHFLGICSLRNEQKHQYYLKNGTYGNIYNGNKYNAENGINDNIYSAVSGPDLSGATEPVTTQDRQENMRGEINKIGFIPAESGFPKRQRMENCARQNDLEARGS